MIAIMTMDSQTWLLLVISLPTTSATARMRIWRNLKALGCAALRDGAYLLPSTPHLQGQLQELAAETTRESGNAWLLTVHPQSGLESAAFRSLFDRSQEYADWLAALSAARGMLPQQSAQDINRILRKFRREHEAMAAVDYFPGEPAAQAEAAWLEFLKEAEALLSPGEPQAVDTAIAKLDPAQFQGRRWATRRSLWVDRVASAWLIRRFIDQGASFLWLGSPADCPADVLGFDFDGAAFTHVGERITFEVLLASFGLEQDKGLARLAALVHALDVGGMFVPEALGFEAVMSGARARAADDDQLLAEMSLVLDSMYTHFGNDLPPRKTKGEQIVSERNA
jgi:hypothetical protein